MSQENAVPHPDSAAVGTTPGFRVSGVKFPTSRVGGTDTNKVYGIRDKTPTHKDVTPAVQAAGGGTNDCCSEDAWCSGHLEVEVTQVWYHDGRIPKMAKGWLKAGSPLKVRIATPDSMARTFLPRNAVFQAVLQGLAAQGLEGAEAHLGDMDALEIRLEDGSILSEGDLGDGNSPGAVQNPGWAK